MASGVGSLDTESVKRLREATIYIGFQAWDPTFWLAAATQNSHN